MVVGEVVRVEVDGVVEGEVEVEVGVASGVVASVVGLGGGRCCCGGVLATLLWRRGVYTFVR